MTASLFSTIYSPPPAKSPWTLAEKIPARELRYFSFGRRALAAGLRAIRLKAGDAVLLPSLICRDLLSSLADVGARPLFYPVAPSLRPAQEPAHWPRARAVIAVNYFGFAQDLEPFRAYAARTGAVLIEDNAHGFLSKDDRGSALGTRAELGLFSVRKTLPLPNGAALAFCGESSRWDIPPPSPFEPRADARLKIKSSIRAVARIAGPNAALAALRLARRARAIVCGYRIPPPDADAESVLPEPARAAAGLAGPIFCADPELEAQRRRALYDCLADTMKNAGFSHVFERLPDQTVPYAYPFRASGARAEEAIRLLSRLGIEPLPWPDLPFSEIPAAPAHYRDMWLAHFLW